MKKIYNVTEKHLCNIIDSKEFKENLEILIDTKNHLEHNPYDLLENDLIQVDFYVWQDLFSEEFTIEPIFSGVECVNEKRINFKNDMIYTNFYEMIKIDFDESIDYGFISSGPSAFDLETDEEYAVFGIYGNIGNESNDGMNVTLYRRKNYDKPLVKINWDKDIFSSLFTYDKEGDKIISSGLKKFEFNPKKTGMKSYEMLYGGDIPENLCNEINDLIKKKVKEDLKNKDLMDKDKFYNSFNQEPYDKNK